MAYYISFISPVILIFLGGYIALLSFKVVNPGKNDPVKAAKWDEWHKKYAYARPLSIIMLVIGMLNLLVNLL